MGKLNIVPNGHNKSVYFVLPLIGLNKFSFGGGDNFFNTYLSYNGKIIVLVRDKSVIEEDYWEHSQYLTDFQFNDSELENATIIVYSVPGEYTDDVNKFMEGKYSEFSEPAKQIIRAKSGLPYRTPKVGSTGVDTHKLLLVLEKNEVLRNWLQNQLDIEIKEGDELLDRPNIGSEFMDIDTLIV